jgi:hypothetical protein
MSALRSVIKKIIDRNSVGCNPKTAPPGYFGEMDFGERDLEALR